MSKIPLLGTIAGLLFFLGGCLHNEVDLYEPGDVEAWRTVADVSTPSRASADPVINNRPRLQIETTQGSFVVELFETEAPITVANFLLYVEEGFYEGTIFHRVIPGFMVQGGGFTALMEEKETREPIRNEAGNGIRNQRGTLAMARTSIIDSATAQFFVNVTDNAFLNGDGIIDGYAVFGRVLDGMEVVDGIAAVETSSISGMQDVPLEAVEILSVTRLDDGP